MAGKNLKRLNDILNQDEVDEVIDNKASDQNSPSMGDILQSIRRILSEGDEDELRLDPLDPADDELTAEWSAALDYTEEDDALAAEWESMVSDDETNLSIDWGAALPESLYEAPSLDNKMTDPLKEDETPKAWTFESTEIAKKFDEHVREQLPWYEPLSQFICDIAVSFIPKQGIVYDIGASTGNITKLMADDLKSKGARAVSIEPSHQMAEQWQGEGRLRVLNAEEYHFGKYNPDVAIMFLTLMFMQPAERENFLRGLFKATKPGGAVIIVDKGFIESPAAQVACKAATVAEKRRSGTPGDSYMTKELSLRGEQRPTSLNRVAEIASEYDYDDELIFRFGEFYGLLFVKKSV